MTWNSIKRTVIQTLFFYGGMLLVVVFPMTLTQFITIAVTHLAIGVTVFYWFHVADAAKARKVSGQLDRVKRSVELAAVEETVAQLMRGITFYKEAEQYNLKTGRWLYDTYCENCLSTTDHIDIAHGTCVVCKTSGNLSQERKYQVVRATNGEVYYNFIYLNDGVPRKDGLQSEGWRADYLYGKRLLNGKPREEVV